MRGRHGSIFWSLILISLGVLFLGRNLGFEIRPWLITCQILASFSSFLGTEQASQLLRSDEDPNAARRSLLSGGDIVLLAFPGGSRKRCHESSGL
jgi:hypothetical protein